MSEHPQSIEVPNETVRRSKWAVASMVFVAVSALLMIVSQSLPNPHGWDNLVRNIIKALLWLGSCAVLVLSAVCCMVAARKDRSHKSEVLAATLCCAMAPVAYYVAYHWWPTPELLVIAAADGDLATVKRCVNFGVDINAIASYVRHPFASRHTALTVAAARGNVTVAEFLIKHGADVNRLNGSESSPLDGALVRTNRELCELLISHGARPTGQPFSVGRAEVKNLLKELGVTKEMSIGFVRRRPAR